ncbi:16S rRNA (uracil(1498)-N(3))-methyltransferase [Oleiagrimonas sp. C23AA]|uniref:16S rRNA (uracil(1498)-N(3))-methyltransferase n=1 Tax=Oleiagrimonas sp. C23AA TaxID=2719047 RepID=UPI001420E4BA|nr:16S rRNA (uracil(1498)-N(3))-methyltransferase [Oleiagrimonas sp. C23AA]NII12391.1 16S rRNA (uracil(1498)-N(3))-methyltransferase [Oleiagrimonas sp. C23AA]
MRRIRLYVDAPLQTGQLFELPQRAAEHAVRVLRLREGDGVVLFNGDGHDYNAVLTDVGKRHGTVQVVEADRVASESPLTLTLAQGVARGEKMDLIVQKATELGVTRIVPLLTERSEVKLDAARADKRLAHWLAVAASACEQCGRAVLPQIDAPMALDHWLREPSNTLPTTRLALLPVATLRPRELDSSLHEALLLVGPEGGLGERDLAALQPHGFEGLNLGPRILRTESAGLAALAALQTLYGDM